MRSPVMAGAVEGSQVGESPQSFTFSVCGFYLLECFFFFLTGNSCRRVFFFPSEFTKDREQKVQIKAVLKSQRL